MQHRITPRLRNAVRDILLHDWDPLGIQENEAASSEYDSYVEAICRMLVSGADAYKLTSHLSQLETGSMGLSQNAPNQQETVKQLLSLIR